MSASAFLGGRLSDDRPSIRTISIPEAKKRRQPSKHYVYKIIVQWSNSTSTTIYRRYSMFFDFQVKLQELYTALKERNPSFQGDSGPSLPELPGKILFGRTQVHQVAEKRRVKIEEFCEALVNLPPEISHSALVLGFFNTWPEDTMHHSSHVVSKEPTSPVAMPPTCTSPTSPTSSVINHPDEMDNLEQYRVVADYVRKDNHQVNLSSGQVVHVIEKHYTGWWMIVTDEEQGYAPAAHLEAIDKTYDSAELECNVNEEYIVMESYRTENDDEIELFPGDRVVILHKNMDGWWKIKNSYGVIGYCPATVLRKSVTVIQKSQTSNSYENEQDLYQELNIHKPPPRRSTLERNMAARLFKNSKYSQHRIDTKQPLFEDPTQHYQVPKNSASVSSGSDEGPVPQSIDLNNPPFSPDHYEMGPYFSEESSRNHPIYENTDFDHPEDKKTEPTSSVYQNMDFNEQELPKRKEKDKVEDEEYINPEEFVKEECTMPTQSIPPATSKQGNSSNVTSVSYKTVTIASDPLSPPTLSSSKDSQKNSSSPSHSVKAILTPSKSLGFMDSSKSGNPEEEYIEMDPIYAPVAPDEPEENKDKFSDEDSKVSFAQSMGGIIKKQKPSMPSPYNKSKPTDSFVPAGRVLERTKSLENMLASDSDKKPSSPLLSKKASDGNMKPKVNDYDHLEAKPSELINSSPALSRKPEPAKKTFQKSVISNSPISSAEFRRINSPPVSSPPRTFADDPPPLPPPNFSPSQPMKGPFVPKMYVAIESYDSQAPGCLSFNAGDRCFLVRQSNGGWWYVNIGGTEGWTPGDFWQEDVRMKSNAVNQPPSMAPKKPLNTKPRSQTNAPELNKQHSSNGFQSSLLETRSSSVGNGIDMQRTKPLPGKPRGQGPSKIRSPNSPSTGNKKLEQSISLDSSPPPPPPPRNKSNQVSNEANAVNDYTFLEDASVPSLEDHMWFVGSLEREKAEQFLMENGRQREFLVRERTNRKGYYALSIRYHYSVKHFNIDPQPNGSYSMGIMNFSSIEEVVRHYQLNSLFIHDGQPVALGQPVRRKSRINH